MGDRLDLYEATVRSKKVLQFPHNLPLCFPLALESEDQRENLASAFMRHITQESHLLVPARMPEIENLRVLLLQLIMLYREVSDLLEGPVEDLPE